MRANEFITERKRKKSRRAYGGYFYPGFGYGDNSSGEAGDGGGGEGMYESAIDDLVKELPSFFLELCLDRSDRKTRKVVPHLYILHEE